MLLFIYIYLEGAAFAMGKNKYVAVKKNRRQHIDLEIVCREIEQGNNVGLDTAKTDLICLDIDSIKVAEAFIFVPFQNVLLTPSPRGGLHAWFSCQSDVTLSFKGCNYVITNSSIKLELKAFSVVVLFGPGYDVVHAPSEHCDHLDLLPDWLMPLGVRPSAHWFHHIN